MIKFCAIKSIFIYLLFFEGEILPLGGPKKRSNENPTIVFVGEKWPRFPYFDQKRVEFAIFRP
jgi:hypothetical protein